MRHGIMAALCCAALVAGACTREAAPVSDTERSEGKTRRVRIALSSSDPGTKSSYACGESHIEDYCLFLFDGDGRKVFETYRSGSEPSVASLEEGEAFFAYAVANIGDIRDRIETGEDFADISAQITNESLSQKFPMYGEDIIVMDDVSGEFTIDLTRLVARYTLVLDRSGIRDGSLELTHVQLKNIAASVSVSRYGGVSSADGLLEDGDSSSPGDVAALNSGQSAVFYVPENRQGRESGITSSNMKVPTYGFGTVHPERCTYLEVRCNYCGTNGTVSGLTYRMYLGSNATDDFNVTRNTAYTITLQPDSGHIFDNTWKCENEALARIVLHSRASGEIIDPREVTVAEDCYLFIQNEKSGPLLRNPYKTIKSVTCDDGFSFRKEKKTITGKLTADCICPLLNRAGKATYHITTDDGIVFDYVITAGKPQLRVSEPSSYILLDGSERQLQTAWYDAKGNAVDPDVFFDSEAAQAAFRNIPFGRTALAATRTVLNGNGVDIATTSVDADTRDALVDNLWAGFAEDGSYDVSVALDDNDHLDRVLNGFATGFCCFKPSITLSHANISIPRSVDVKIPWVNTPDRDLGTVNDYSIVPQSVLKSGFSHTGSLGSIMPFPLASQTLTLEGTLSRNAYSHYISAATFRIQAVSSVLNYSFSGIRHPAGRIALVASIANRRNPGCVPLTLYIGRVECYTYIPVGTYTSVRNIGDSFYDEGAQERLYPVSLGIAAFFPYKPTSGQDYPVYWLQNAMKYNGSASRMIRGSSDSQGTLSSYVSGYGTESYSLQTINYPVVDWWPGENGGAALWLKYSYIYNNMEVSGNIGHISDFITCSGVQAFALDAYMAEIWGTRYRLYDWIKSGTYGASSTQTAHYPCQGETRYADDSGLGYYIVTLLEYLTPYKTLEQLNYQVR